MRNLSGLILRANQLLVLLSFLVPVLAQDCSSSNPCEEGCCSIHGFCGYGKDHCAPDNCAFNCDRKAECDPGDFGSDYVNLTACPLNICCSKHGFCGTTEEFCGDKKMPKPKECSGLKKFSRVIAYYESWAMDRPCNQFNPEKIPTGVYTHINFAFATIDPKTFEVRPETTADINMYKRLVSLKRRDPNLRVLIAIGGWTFNDPGPTEYVFSDIARSKKNQDKFIKSLVSFMATYGFDGVDLDWEYPQAPDRSGRDEDYKNFPELLKNMKKGLKDSGRDEISITIPASLWYLKHFDIVAMEKHVDFFNVMSYDLHGTWDLTNAHVGPYLNAHTNLTEIDSALDLLWLNDIDPDKVVMGLAFYGRSFRLEDPSCTEPGCRYGSGSAKNPCSQEAGIILNSEINDILDDTAASPKLYKKEAVKALVYDDNNWVAYDDEHTLEMKTDFAHKRCLGGVMVWAVSHDTSDARYSKALARHAPLEIPSIALPIHDDDPSVTYTNYAQCKWTNCGEGCPSGWSTIKRYDDGGSKGEIMLDGQGCDGHGVHTLCCPASNGLPTCGWYKHRNGDCTPACPDEWVEVGGNNQHCYGTGVANFKSYQAACCSTLVGVGSRRVEFDNMKLYGQCGWGEWPYCDGKCSSSQADDLVVQSMQGSGGAQCFGSLKGRSLCCDHDDEHWQWENCDWYKSLGGGASGSKNCKPGCPSNKVRVAMDDTDCDNGAFAYCCTPTARTVEKRSDPMMEVYTDALETFTQDPTCPAGYEEVEDIEPRSLHLAIRTLLSRGSRNTNHSTGTSRSVLSRRATETDILTVVEEVGENIAWGYGASSEMIDLWDNIIAVEWEHLTASNIAAYVAQDPFGLVAVGGVAVAIRYMICNMDDMNRILGGDAGADDETVTCNSETYLCEIVISPFSRTLDWTVTRNGVTYSGTVTFRNYPSVGAWNVDDANQNVIYMEVYDWPLSGCSLSIRTVNRLGEAASGLLSDVAASEHLIELQTVPRWYEAAIQGVLADGSTATNRIDSSFFTQTLSDTNVLGQLTGLRTPRGYEGGVTVDLGTVEQRLVNSLGSNRNMDVFLIAINQLNCFKKNLWNNNDPIGESTMNGLMTRDANNADRALTHMHNVVNVFNYLNDDVVHSSMVNVMMEFRRELRVAERAHRQLTGNPVSLVASFDEFMVSLFVRIRDKMREFIRQWVQELRNVWDDINNPLDISVLALAATLQNAANNIAIDQTDFYQQV